MAKRPIRVTSAKPPTQAAAEPKELVIIPGANHVDLYDHVDVIPFDKLTAFFRTNLR